MNVQSLQQHNPGTASVHVGPSEPDNHLHLHELWRAGGGKAKEIGGQQQQQQQLVVAGGAGTVVTGTGSTACQECGNQAKKDCSYQRCRTCCKSRGFECSTHLKSTWVPAAKRRERQAAESAAAASSGLLRSKSKRARTLVANVANSLTTTSATSPRGSDLNSAHLTATHPSQPASSKGGLPPEVRAQALFKCVRLMGVEDGENEFAYQATVKIGGHIFKGVLYDQGVDNGQAAVPSLGELQLGGNRGGMPSSSALIDPSTLYVSGSALLGALR
ncbi:hypothetical protein CY35_08G017100 [Sphagnum magellanicum]|nr:hypothetical protein CY35_08G017100 [Sphagnum magellanicum]